VKIEGNYKFPTYNESALANDIIGLFNGRNFERWYIYKKESL